MLLIHNWERISQYNHCNCVQMGRWLQRGPVDGQTEWSRGLGNVRNGDSWIKAHNLLPGLGFWALPSLPQGKERKPPAVSAEVGDLREARQSPA